MKYIVTTVLILSVLYFQACSTFVNLGKDEMKSAENREELYVTMSNKNQYYFGAGDYYIQGDTLYGRGKSISSEMGQSTLKLCLSEIAEFNVREDAPLLTGLLIVGVTASLFILTLGSISGIFSSFAFHD